LRASIDGDNEGGTSHVSSHKEIAWQTLMFWHGIIPSFFIVRSVAHFTVDLRK